MTDPMTIEVGDRIRFTTELLKHIDEMPNHSTEVVVVHGIELAEDGTKTITLLRMSE